MIHWLVHKWKCFKSNCALAHFHWYLWRASRQELQFRRYFWNVLDLANQSPSDVKTKEIHELRAVAEHICDQMESAWKRMMDARREAYAEPQRNQSGAR